MQSETAGAKISKYLASVQEQFNSGHAVEHAYRPALQQLMQSHQDTVAVNDPKKSEFGAPDFIFLQASNPNIIKGYAEAKDVGTPLDKVEQSEQMLRYAGYANLFLTDYLEFRFYANGQRYNEISIGHLLKGQLVLAPDASERLWRELKAFLDLPPEKIKSGKRLAEIMGAKARRIRDNVAGFLTSPKEAPDLSKIYQLMKNMLVHDLDVAKFADMYAQTLVYGLFIARYADKTLDDFSRSEARDLVPRSNPFLREFFDHIAGIGFDSRLAKIVDELCEVFRVSNVEEIVHQHLRIQDGTTSVKDPIIHFYEDFLQAYDPTQRRKMGAYYTPAPVVKFIIRNIDEILKNDFKISRGLASTERASYEVATQPWRRKGERIDRLTKEVTGPHVQILDPAVGTATFLNEIVKHIHASFHGQEGRWPGYVRDNLVPRLYGFELMMAPYTIAHLKLGMTLRETGVEQLNSRLNVFLTNTLEEGVPTQPDLFSFGLADAVSEESRLAAEVKGERPVMVVVGNPPYSGVSSNETPFANRLVDRYKVEPGGHDRLRERKHWLNDDYVKFVAFAEDMIAKNGSGVMGMITNNGYLDNPTFRGMRWHLLNTFDKIYVLDLHGNINKQEKAPDGSSDQNVFDIMQGVGILLAVKTGAKKKGKLAEIFHAETFGLREEKFDYLNQEIEWEAVKPTDGHYFKPRRAVESKEYSEGIAINDLFIVGGLGIVTGRDRLAISFESNELARRVELFRSMSVEDARVNFELGKDSTTWKVEWAQQDLTEHESDASIRRIQFRPFDYRYCYYLPYSSGFLVRPNLRVMKHFLADDENLGLVTTRLQKSNPGAFISESMVTHKVFNSYDSNSIFPLWLTHEDGERSSNLRVAEVKRLCARLSEIPSPEDLLDYIYGVLWSPSYRLQNAERMQVGFPRVPVIASDQEFSRIAALGRQLRLVHLMKSDLLDTFATTYPMAGSDIVETIVYTSEKVYINDDQYFGKVPEIAWNTYVGGYQPARKWLNERKGRSLSDDELTHYQRLIAALVETDRIMNEIG